MDLFLVRHGETDANYNKITQGWLDTDLNENGIRQATTAAITFKESVDVIYSSDLKRAKQTAELFRNKFPSIPYYEDCRLRERNFGEATGRPISEIDWDVFWSAPPNDVPLSGAESLEEYNKRVQDFTDMLRETSFSSALIVTHSGTINRFRDLINGEAYAHHANGSIVHLKI